MMISDNKLDAYRFAKKLVEINAERKELTKTYVEPIIRAITAEQDRNPTAIVVHYHPDVPEGIIGLVAARLANHFYKPAILLSDAEEDGIYKGSGRSIKGFDLFTSLMGQTSLMEGFGGHSAACGLSLKAENFDALKTRLEFYAEATLSREDLQKKIYIDCVIEDPTILDIDFVKDMSRLEPFGNGNQRPTFMMKNMRIIREMPVGEEKNHLWALMSNGKTTFGTIGFFLYEKYEALGKPKNIDVAFFPNLNEYPKGSGKINVQLELEDIRKAEKAKSTKGRDKKHA
ncbi:Single-stranded-DNA-specific exonuclease RecJ [compost metagenome]